MNKRGLCAGTLAAVMLYAASANGEVAPVQQDIAITAEPTQKVEKTVKKIIGPTVAPTVIPTESPEDLAEEEYFDSLEELAICVEAEAGNQRITRKENGCGRNPE